ncbi:DUF885 domain-containing protein [Shewanella electrodiphila]|uniref:DUF885 domain-containing protein n=1 Tax=Shewanella electrodiphila TaxID=934143 RepID=A0ABT0KMP5_9GAMM|nr:DUF885 domain-containing protein [Shewanella electrodiphila]MCL1045023.1 DUF885 domain-containing protein [Shewanella electrodiphila]
MIKKSLKWLGLGTLGVATIGASFAAHEWYADKPFMFRSYLDRQMVKMAFKDPEGLTSLGFLESVGIKGHNAHLDDVDPSNSKAVFDEMKSFRDGLHQYEDNNLDENQLISKQIALYLTGLIDDFDKFQYHTYPANQMFGIQSGFPSFMESSHQVATVEDAENYLSRMGELNRKFSQYLLALQEREDRNIIPPRFVIQRVLDEMHGFVATPANENILYTSLVTKFDATEEISDSEKARLLAQTEQAIIDSIYPAYDLFINYFEALKPKAGTDDGYWHLPQGEQAYALALKLFTTTDYTPDYIHELGLTEVARIQAEMLVLFEQEGIDTSDGYLAAMNTFSDKPEYYYEDSDEGRAQILVDYQTILDEINDGLDDSFNIRPKAGMEVVRIPEFKEKTAPGAYYQGPSLDGSRPGRFFANLYDIKTSPKYAMRTLAYHEGIPGHHFQVSIAMELEGMPLLRRFAPFTAYSEGWALYAERLAYEQGFQNTPADNIGRLTDELLRAVRLVVDTGLHHKRWTREESIAYMSASTGRAERDVISEIERYIVMPGQATSYKVGMMKILELRQKAQDKLQDKYDIREFHDAVLKNGAMPLDLLETVIDQYIEQRLQQA